MLKDKSLTYVTLFSSAGVGCHGFQMEGYHCIATNEIIERRMQVQRCNHKCEYESGYISGDITSEDIKQRIYDEIHVWEKKGNDRVDVIIATPPCQGISVINHKKNDREINRNSLVVESVEIIHRIKPRFFILENVMAFQKTLCITPDERIVPIGEYVREVLGKDYIISGRILNFMNYGSNSSRTRTLMIGVDKAYRNNITPYDIYPEFRQEKTLRDVIYDYPRLEWGEICAEDFYHAFRTYKLEMRSWIHDLKEGESAFDNADPTKRPHRVIDGKIVENMDVLEYIALRERNSFEFLCLYIEKTLKDSGLWDSFETFFELQTKESLQELKTKFSDFCIKYTPINTAVEANRIFIKVLNPLACKLHKKGVEKGHLSRSMITYDKIMYNQTNWRDDAVGKDKNVARGDFNPQPKTEQMYQYRISRAMKYLRKFNDDHREGLSEVLDRFSVGEKATHMHHIFPQNEFAEIADYIENLIALTSGQHLQKAHPNGNTQVIDKQYQYTCLIAKTESIRKNIMANKGEPIIYDFAAFMFVLDVGLRTDYFEALPSCDFNSVVTGIEFNY